MLLFVLSILILLLFSIPLLRSLRNVKNNQYVSQRKKSLHAEIAILLTGILIVVLFNIFLNFITEYFWFANLGYTGRFWTVFFARLFLFIGGSGIIALFLYTNYAILRSRLGIRGRGYGLYGILIISFFFGFWPASLWNEVLLFINQVRSPLEEPILGRSISFYLFSLPLYSAFIGWFISGLLAAYTIPGFFLFSRYSKMDSPDEIRFTISEFAGHFLFLTSLLCLVAAWYFYLQIYYLLYGNATAVVGAGYTDAHVGIYANAIIAGILALFAIMLFIGSFSKPFRKHFIFIPDRSINPRVAIYPVTIVVLMVLLLWLIPNLVQFLYVSPNEITLEKPYLVNNITFTRSGYSITQERVEEELYRIGRNITTSVIKDNESTLMNVRLWDWRALLENLRQQQEIRLYYRFNDVDIDRYNLDGEYRQVMLAVRELSQEDLDPRSKNWVSLHLKYTHGFGAVLLPAHDILSQGQPRLLIRGIPPQSSVKSVTINQPRIYYGELTDNFVYVNTTELEFDYPIGDQVEYNSYSGKGGVSIGSFINKFLYTLRFDDYKLLISGYFTDKSKILFRRSIRERAQAIMPFLQFDRDPYPVITDNGRIVWILDSYTTSSMYPYSQPYQGLLNHFHGNNYIRNPVKVVIDAYDGTVDPYIIDSSDVIISTYQRIFPDLFKNFNEMPEDLKKHIRYPTDFFTIQSEMYAAYHMVNPETFYQREDLWEYATERYRGEFQPISPYYVMIEFSGRDSIEFALIVPFTPRNKNVMNGWIAGHSDIPHYGDMTVYPIPKGVEVFGPRQIEARIDQNTIMSQSITLWGQQGSEVIRGNLLVIPLFHRDSLFVMYAEPVLIQANDARLPEIKRIILADQEHVIWAERFEQALELLATREGFVGEVTEPGVPGPETGGDTQKAGKLMQEFRELVNQGNYSEAGARLEQLMNLFENQK
ncbi:MAG: UPF0182 family protein [Chitinispirillaceae bacterium]|nr:UPF0182 family protein [Chitinispirillaceae bacterium]